MEGETTLVQETEDSKTSRLQYFFIGILFAGLVIVVIAAPPRHLKVPWLSRTCSLKKSSVLNSIRHAPRYGDFFYIHSVRVITTTHQGVFLLAGPNRSNVPRRVPERQPKINQPVLLVVRENLGEVVVALVVWPLLHRR
ncbi:hypothetical protein MRX96_019808 [Rhipicephalus microplus]